jgi:ATP/maltotriose-dependent transcriptional regulator MalT
MKVGRLTDAEAYVLEAEHWLESHAQASDPKIDSVRGKALALRAQFASRRGEFTQSIELSQRAAQLVDHDDLAWRNLVTFTLADAFRYTINWAEAKGAYQEAAALSESAGDYANALFALGSLGEVLEAEGQLRQAAQQFEKVLRLARAWGVPNAAATGYAWVGLGRVRSEWNELDAALQNVEAGLARGQQAEITDVLLRGYHALGVFRKAQGDLDVRCSPLSMKPMPSQRKWA